MKRIILLLILCLLAAGMFFSCFYVHDAEPQPQPTPEPEYYIEYTRGVYILREMIR